ncbi:MAG: AMIN domain-containing protein [Deltaproteobacteria bacterium]|jgi:hypothetical protein|nr:AMIN domain-containing protein [Deltaproteobacteria bacterium]
MNKFITMLSLGVVVAAMLLVLGMHLRQSADGEPQAPAVLSSAVEVGTESAAGGAPGGSLPGLIPPEDEDSSFSLRTPVRPPADGGNQDVTPMDGGAAGGQPAVIPVRGGQGAVASSPTPGPTPDRTPSVAPGRQPAATAGTPAPATRSAPATASVSRGRGSIVELSLQFRGRGMALVIEGSGPLPARHFVLAGPDRLVVDLPGSWSNLKVPAVPSNNLVKSARLGRQDDADRLVLDLKTRLKSHSINRISDKKIEVLFN